MKDVVVLWADLNVEGNNREEKLFRLLVTVATAYEEELVRAAGEDFKQIGLDPLHTPRDIMMKGLLENLQLNEEG